MITKEYAMAYREVIEILNHMPDESVAKIPQEELDFYRENMDTSYDYKIDEEKEFEEQIISDTTKATLAVIFRDYWATPYQRERIIAKEKYDMDKMEEEKREKYNPDDIFKNKQTEEVQEEITNLPMEIKKENFFRRLISFISRLFK